MGSGPPARRVYGLKTNLPLFRYSIFEASVQASKNILYFHLVVEILICIKRMGNHV
jgi:hypothetical protein